MLKSGDPCLPQVYAGPVLSPRVPLPPACRSSESSRTSGVITGRHAPSKLSRDLQDLCCRLVFYCPLQSAQGPAGPSLCSQAPLSCSGTHMSCGVVSGPSSPLQSAQGIKGPVVSFYDPPLSACHLLRDPNDLCCCIVTHCTMQAAQGPVGPLTLPQDPLPHASCCSETCAEILGSTAGCSGTHRTCAVF